MTTPERLKRRQLLELRALIVLGVLLLVLGITQIAAARYFRGEDRAQRACLAQNLGGLADALTVRGQIANREAKAARLEAAATRMESQANNMFYQTIFSATSQDQVRAAYADYRRKLSTVNDMRATVDRRRDQIKQDRAENPIPAFPAGRCE